MSNWTRFMAGFDVHGDQQSKPACEVFFKFMKDWKPEIRVMGGDLFDFRPLRRKASEDEKRESMREDFEAGMEWFNRFKPNHYLRGNHCERLWELAQADRGVESDYAYQGVREIETVAERLKCKVYPYHKAKGVARIGTHLKAIHGFASGVYAARQTALVYGSVLFGHVHCVDEHSIPGLERRVARCCGCLCELDMDYAARTPSTMRQANGFAYGVINKKTGLYHVWTAESIDGHWLIPSDVVEYK